MSRAVDGARTRRAVTLGVFDGLHLGHRALVDRLVREAAGESLLPAVVTLEPHPDVVLGHAPPRPPLTPLHVQAPLLAEWGARELRVLRFDSRLRETRAAAFVRHYLAARLNAAVLVVGPDFALGWNREGTPARLAELGRELGLRVVQEQPVRDSGGPVSSSRLRRLLDEGRVAEAVPLLGRPFCTEGVVSPGRGMGRTLGFPTANLVSPEPAYLPADGIYRGTASGSLGSRPCLVSLGARPTFGPGERVLEVYVLDFDGDLSGQRLRVDWLAYQRGQQRFHSPEDLIEQMRQDERVAREAFGLGARER